MEKLINCPYCQSSNLLVKIDSKDHFLTNEKFKVFKCETCLIHFTNPFPSESEIVKYYKSDDYISHGLNKPSLFNSLYKLVRTFSLKWKLSIIKRYSKAGSILDYGCGTGEFLEVCKENQYNINGIEPGEKAREKASIRTKEKIFTTITDIQSTEEFDVITLWHVLEHVQKLKILLDELKAKIKKQGTLIVAVPNHESYDAQYYKSNWAAYDLPRHLWHFDKNTMSKILVNSGFELVEIIPMKLDSYYVSILSSNYKYGKGWFSLLNGFLNGFISNAKAKKKNNYSSLIYVAKLK